MACFWVLRCYLTADNCYSKTSDTRVILEPRIFGIRRMHYRWFNALADHHEIYLEIVFFAYSSYFYISFITKVILMPQAVSSRFPTVEAQVRSLGRICGIYGQQRGTATSFVLGSLVFPDHCHFSVQSQYTQCLFYAFLL